MIASSAPEREKKKKNAMFKLNFDGMFSEFYGMMCTDIFANFEKIVFINQKKVGVGIVRCDLPLP